MDSIVKVEKEILLDEYDCLLNLPDGIYKYNILNVDKNKIKEFLKEKNIFSNQNLSIIKFIIK